MTCRCGESRRAEAKHTFRRTVAGTTFTAETKIEACAGCGEIHVPAALVLSFERAVAVELARRGPASGETFRWIRRAAALGRVELGQVLGAPVETIAAWEEERRPVDPAVWTLVAAMALDAHEGPRPLRARIKARRRAATRSDTTLELSLDRASVGTLAKALELLAAKVTDADVADALDIDCAALRARLRELESASLVRCSPDAAPDGPFRWEPSGAPTSMNCAAEELLRAAAAAGLELDAPLPRATYLSETKSSAPQARGAPSRVST